MNLLVQGLYIRVYDFEKLHENKILYDIMLWNKSLIKDIYIIYIQGVSKKTRFREPQP